jgi:4-hydroxy-tetrahydrodipicolinate reductase
MASEVRLCILGASGRLGSRIVALAGLTEFPPRPGERGVRVSRAVVRATSPLVGQPVPGMSIQFESDRAPLQDCDAVIDVSLPEAAVDHARQAANAGLPLLVAVTGLAASACQELGECAREIPLCLAPNLSGGVWVLAHLVQQAARALPLYDVEIVETHHRNKRDAPSGTALLLGQHAAAGRAVKLDDVKDTARASSPGKRALGSVGFASLRGGDVVGDHMVALLGDGERLELTHRAHSRDTFARGALNLAPRLVGRRPGLVSVPELLGLG